MSFKAGDMVKIVSLPVGNSTSEMQQMEDSGKSFEVMKRVIRGYLVYNDDKSDHWYFEKENLESANKHKQSYTILIPITIPNIMAKAPNSDEWRREFCAALKEFPNGVTDADLEKFVGRSSQKVLDWLVNEGFLQKSERMYGPGDRFRDDSGKEFLVCLDRENDFRLLHEYKLMDIFFNTNKKRSAYEIKTKWLEHITGDIHPID